MFVLIHVFVGMARAETTGSREGPSREWLSWARADGAQTCIDADGFASRVQQLVGKSPEQVARETGRRLFVRIERTTSLPSSWSGEVTVFDSDDTVIGRRKIVKSSESCGPIEDALALIVALNLPYRAGQVETQSAGISTPDQDTPRPVVLKTTPSPPQVPSAHAAKASSAWAFAIDAGLAASVGLLPTPSPGGELRLRGVSATRVAPYVSSVMWPGETRSVAAARGATLDLWTLGFGLCLPGYVTGSVAIDLCAGGDGGRVHASSFGFANAIEQVRWFVDVAAGGQFEVMLAHGLLIGLELQLMVPLLRVREVYSAGTETVEIWRSWPVVPVGLLHVGYLFQ